MADDPKRILVADADESIRSMISLTLDGDSYDVIEASDTTEALTAIASHLPDVLILDAELPGAGGLKICKSLRAQPETQHANVLLMFEKSNPIDQAAGEDAGVDKYLAKPFNSMSLLKKVGEFEHGQD